MAHIFLRRYFNINLLKKRHLYIKLNRGISIEI